MPTVPNTKTLNANSADVLNAVRSDIGGTYADMVPRVVPGNTETLHAAGAAILDFTPNRNAFLTALFNRIGRVLITSKMYSNPWQMFKKGMLDYGETIEEIFVNLAHVEDFDPEKAETELYKREIPDVRAAFHTMNYQKVYKTTVSEAQLRTAFLSFDGVTDLITRIVDAIYTSANYDEFLVMKYMTAKAIVHGAMYPVTIPEVTPANSKEIVTKIKGISNALTFMNTAYNVNGVHTHTQKADQIILMNATFDAVIDVEVLASAFNIDYVKFMGQRVIFDSLSDTDSARLAEIFKYDKNYTPLTEAEKTLLDTIPAVLVDRDWFMIFDNYINTTDVFNSQGLYTNFFLHTWKTFSTSPFQNAIAFTTQATTVTGVTVSPATATIAPGKSIQLTADVSGSGVSIDSVTWSIPDDVPATISPNGLVTALPTTTATEVTVTATSTLNPDVSGTATITVNP